MCVLGGGGVSVVDPASEERVAQGPVLAKLGDSLNLTNMIHFYHWTFYLSHSHILIDRFLSLNT